MKAQRLLQGIGLFIFVSVFLTGSLIIFAFGALSFTALALMWLRQHFRHEQAVLKTGCGPSENRELHYVSGVMLLVCALWFYANIVLDLWLAQGGAMRQFQAGLFAFAYIFPPLIMHIFYAEHRPEVLRLGPVWKRIIKLAYLGSALAIALIILGMLQLIQAPWQGLSFTLSGCFVAAGIFGAAFMSRWRKRKERPEEKRGRWWTLALLALIVCLSILSAVKEFRFQELVSVVLRAAPLYFIFVGTYYNDRFEFFDVFIKRAIFFFLVFWLSVGVFAGVSPWLEQADWPQASPNQPALIKPIVFAAILLPFMLVLPWAYGKLEKWLDRAWLGRRFTPSEALHHFLKGLQRASREKELVEQAEVLFSEIFQAPARIYLHGAPGEEALRGEAGLEAPVHLRVSLTPDLLGQVLGDADLDVPVCLREGVPGSIVMGRRRNDTPFFSQDLSLLRLLALFFASMLENTRLLEKRQEQERRERELKLYASRSELKALRAQINPHFLFNALNAIAGLVHRNPERAEETVEQLAEVFRYTLTRSDKEWVPLREEMELVRSYLGVEQARFGDRLKVSIEAEPGLLDVKVPTMMLQTLVENAVKHGIARVRGGGMIRVEVKKNGGFLRMAVGDNGPGFQETDTAASCGKPQNGYGLKNIRERLEGNFGSAAALKLERNQQEALTIVSIEMPLKMLPHEEKLEISE